MRFRWFAIVVLWSFVAVAASINRVEGQDESPAASSAGEPGDAAAEVTSSEADAAEPTEEDNRAAIEQIEKQLQYQEGKVAIGNGLATLNLPKGLRYLDPKQTKFIVEELWNNPSGNEFLGMIVPAGMSVLQKESWAVIIQYEASGYISDEDAKSIDYDQMLRDMQAGEAETNKARAEQNFEPIHLVGWAKPPHYDASTKKLYWAKELEFGGSPEHVLNYNIRVLGRRGYLQLNMVGGMEQLTEIDSTTPQVLAAVEFNDGERYADFNQATDAVAKYGIAALVAGGVAAKAGLFKGLLIALLAAKKLVIVGVAAFGAMIAKIFKRSRAN